MRINSAKYENGRLILEAPPIARRFVYEFKPGEYEIARARGKRSLNANSYAWALITEIANAVRLDKNDVYLDSLRSYGQSEIVSVRSDVNVKGFFKYYEEAGCGSIGGNPFTHYRVYKGSSEYDTREMSVLIDGIVQEAKSLDIETLTPLELERIKSEWG